MNPQRTPRRPRLTHKAEKILRALLEHPTQEKAAAAAGVWTTTIWRYQRMPKFRRALAEVHREAVSQAGARLQQAANAAAATLVNVMVDRATPPATRLRAADRVLDKAAVAVQMEDFSVRLLELERPSEPQRLGVAPKRGRSARPTAHLKKAA